MCFPTVFQNSAKVKNSEPSDPADFSKIQENSMKFNKIQSKSNLGASNSKNVKIWLLASLANSLINIVD
jgi:hypothetical protein